MDGLDPREPRNEVSSLILPSATKKETTLNMSKIVLFLGGG